MIEIKFAGICHSDIHTVRDEWGKSEYPCVPGHEIAGPIVAVGENVKGFAVGEIGGVGCLVDSCRDCWSCKLGNEQYCEEGAVWTYNSKLKHGPHAGASTYGGYSRHIVVDASFALKIPANLDLAAATPLLCAGITVYSPMIHFGLQPHMKFGVAGLGGLGHVAVKLGRAFGAHTTVISRGTSKRDTAINHLGANDYIDSTADGALQVGYVAPSRKFLSIYNIFCVVSRRPRSPWTSLFPPFLLRMMLVLI